MYPAVGSASFIPDGWIHFLVSWEGGEIHSYYIFLEWEKVFRFLLVPPLKSVVSLLHMHHLLCTARAAICFLTLVWVHVFVVVFVHRGIHTPFAHHILPPTNTLACCVVFPCQLAPQAAALIGQRPCRGERKWERKKKYNTNSWK